MRHLLHRLRGSLVRLRGVFARGRMERRLAEEVRFHVEMATAENRRRGMSEENARRAALVAFGGAERWKEASRDEYRIRTFEDLTQDIRQAIRSLLRSPSFALAALATLTLCIGATTSIFSVINVVLLRELPYPRADRLVALCERNVSVKDAPACNSINPGNFLAWKDAARSFEGLAAFVEIRVSVGGGDAEPVAARARLATSDAFAILGARAARGRLYTEDDDRPGAPGVVVLSAEFWQRHFGGDPDLIGGTIVVDGRPQTVIGVAPPGFGLYEPVDLWIPMRFSAEHRTIPGRYLRAIARLRDGVTEAQAIRELADLATGRASALPAVNASWTALALPLGDFLTGSSRRTLWPMLGMVGFLLLLACANLANLTLARAAARQREIAVRVSLGAAPGRIVRQLLTESLVLSVTATALGIALAFEGTRALMVLVPDGVRALAPSPTPIDWRVALFTATVALGTTLVVGLLPALQAGRQRGQEALRTAGRGATGVSRSGARLRSGLVVVEVALAVVLLVGAGLMIRSFNALQSVDLGFEPARVLTARVVLPGSRYSSDTKREAFFRTGAARLAATSGVMSVGWISYLPLTGLRSSNGFNIEGRPRAPLGAEPVGDMRAVTPGYFAAMGIPLLEGRGLAETDGEDSPAVAVIGESLARRFWPTGSAVGHHLLYEWNANERVEIVGVVGDVHHEGPAGAPLLEIYRPLTQFPHSAMTLVVRGSGDPLANAGSVRALIRELDRDLPIADLQAMDALVRDAVGPTRLIATLFSLFSGLGLLLAAIGIYGLMTYTVQQRRQEFGIRLALGGHAGSLVALTVRRGALLTMKGLAIGIAIAFLASRLLSRLLFGVVPSDHITYGVTAAVLSVVGLAAAYLPGRRAAQVNPVSLLRSE